MLLPVAGLTTYRRGRPRVFLSPEEDESLWWLLGFLGGTTTSALAFCSCDCVCGCCFEGELEDGVVVAMALAELVEVDALCVVFLARLRGLVLVLEEEEGDDDVLTSLALLGSLLICCSRNVFFCSSWSSFCLSSSSI